ncbi:hypothetical protein HCUR_00011 [Holospora curviuscula]|uniref:Uncharacterized protein n=1 Tax=Holospora curviuscula TaxID=1082868 RepID=A0A2S5RI00_9PROT|nr:hypothetical protein HCUR_00011 [Holospora curviuscula]
MMFPRQFLGNLEFFYRGTLELTLQCVKDTLLANIHSFAFFILSDIKISLFQWLHVNVGSEFVTYCCELSLFRLLH